MTLNELYEKSHITFSTILILINNLNRDIEEYKKSNLGNGQVIKIPNNPKGAKKQ